MALVKCPECGKEGVSDCAEMCPDCGYPIKTYFDKIKAEEIKRKYEEELYEKLEQQQEEYDKELEKRSRYVKLPKVRPFINGQTIIGIIFLLGALFMLYIEAYGTMILAGIVSAGYFMIGSEKLKKTREIYDKYKQDENLYKKEIIRAQDIEKVQDEMVKKYRENSKNNNQYNLKCPVCGSKAISKISTISRATSIALVGAASSKIGKQYECRNCKHKW